MIGFLAAGLIIGALARLFRPGPDHIGLLWTLVIGVVGAVIGGVIASVLGTGDIWELNVIGFIAAVIAAIVLLGIAENAGIGRDKPSRLA